MTDDCPRPSFYDIVNNMFYLLDLLLWIRLHWTEVSPIIWRFVRSTNRPTFISRCPACRDLWFQVKGLCSRSRSPHPHSLGTKPSHGNLLPEERKFSAKLFLFSYLSDVFPVPILDEPFSRLTTIWTTDLYNWMEGQSIQYESQPMR